MKMETMTDRRFFPSFVEEGGNFEERGGSIHNSPKIGRGIRLRPTSVYREGAADAADHDLWPFWEPEEKRGALA